MALVSWLTRGVIGLCAFRASLDTFLASCQEGWLAPRMPSVRVEERKKACAQWTCTRVEEMSTVSRASRVELQVGSSQSHGPSPWPWRAVVRRLQSLCSYVREKDGGVVLVLGVVPCSSLWIPQSPRRPRHWPCHQLPEPWLALVQNSALLLFSHMTPASVSPVASGWMVVSAPEAWRKAGGRERT